KIIFLVFDWKLCFLLAYLICKIHKLYDIFIPFSYGFSIHFISSTPHPFSSPSLLTHGLNQANGFEDEAA
ncbi:hypothetical protein, partial [Rickettsiales endosymbiont of Peranema trichophorum]|uniref:hypothetical protein n=1 Tax=Rickettsiales endosymbiont of Peranema trichophorum TaxID=2486577 RepID=UPI001A92E72D